MNEFRYPTKEMILADIDEAVREATAMSVKKNMEKEMSILQAKCDIRQAIKNLKQFGDSEYVSLPFLTEKERQELVRSLVPSDHPNLRVYCNVKRDCAQLAGDCACFTLKQSS